MKHTTPDLMKFKRLQRRLNVPKYVVVGLLESLWIATAKNAPRGDIGRFDNEAIAIELDWDGDPDELIDALAECGWLDRCENHRLVVHDWQDHAPRWVHAAAKREGGMVEKPQSPLMVQSGTIAGHYSEPLQSGTIEGDCTALQPPSKPSTVGHPRARVLPNQTKPNQTQPMKNPSDSSPQSEAPRTQEPVLTEFVFPVVGKGPDHWTLPLADLQEFRKAYPIDIEAEMRKAAVWLRSNPQRRKTARGMMRFLNAWLEKAVNRASGLAMAGSKPKPESRVPTLEDLENYRPYGPD